MTFGRMLISAWLTAQLVDPTWSGSRIWAVIIAAFVWHVATTDPLPAAINHGLEAFKERHQR